MLVSGCSISDAVLEGAASSAPDSGSPLRHSILPLLLAVLVTASPSARGALPPEVAALAARAEQGEAAAQWQLGICYREGNGVARDEREAFDLFSKAAAQDHAEAQVDLGYFYEQGIAVKTDYALAMEWYRKAAEQNQPQAQNNIGALYIEGHGVKTDPVEGLKWIRKAADQGLPHAMLVLGRMYAEGVGTKRDRVEALSWLEMARRERIPEASVVGDKILPFLAPKERAEAARRADARSVKPASPPTTGSGFFITEDGYFLTCEHVIRNASHIVVRTQAGSFPAQLVAADRANDTALLKVQGKFRPLPIAPSGSVKLADAVFTIGFPNLGTQGFLPRFTDGRISSLAGEKDDPRLFQISVASPPGNAGGALVDARGNAVGLVASGLLAKPLLEVNGTVPQSVHYAVKSAYVLALLDGCPEVGAKLTPPRTGAERDLPDMVKEAEAAVAIVVVN